MMLREGVLVTSVRESREEKRLIGFKEMGHTEPKKKIKRAGLHRKNSGPGV
jgi:hypothetical protein